MNAQFLKKIDDERAYRLLNVGATVFVGSCVADDFDIMAAAWNTALNISPCRSLVVVDAPHYTRKLIDTSGHFILSVPSVKAASELLYCGSVSKNDNKDKLIKIQDRLVQLDDLPMPVVDDCLGHLYFKVIKNEVNEKSYDLFMGELVCAYADSRYFDGHFKSDVSDDASLSVHYVAGSHCFKLGQEFIPKSIE